jgi:hypothetical protein
MNYFTYRRSLRKLNRELDEADKAISKAIENVRKAGEKDPEHANEAEWPRHIWEGIDEEISSLVSRYFLSKANKKFLPIPKISKNSEYWEQGFQTGNLYLTNKGITEIRNLLIKETREKYSFWMTFLLGLIGAVTGLVAVIKS